MDVSCHRIETEDKTMTYAHLLVCSVYSFATDLAKNIPMSPLLVDNQALVATCISLYRMYRFRKRARYLPKKMPVTSLYIYILTSVYIDVVTGMTKSGHAADVLSNSSFYAFALCTTAIFAKSISIINVHP